MYKSLICLFVILFIYSTAKSQCSVAVNENGFEYIVDIDLTIDGAIFTQEGTTCNVEIDITYDIEIDVINQPGWWNESLYVLQGSLDCAGGSGTSFFELPNNGGSGNVTSATFSFDNENCEDVTLDCPITIEIQGPQLNSTVDCGVYLGIALPVMLSSFEYSDLDRSNIEILWTTQNEINFSHFELQTSTDLVKWKTEAVISSKNTLSGDNYSLSIVRDELSLYTRLKMIDNDGNYEYSDVLHIEANNYNTLSIFPNPTIDIIYFDGMLVEKVLITNSMGQISTFPIGDVQSLDLSSLISGFYIIQAQNSNVTSESVRFVKQ